ncbi:transmembrane 9 superfamily member 1 [Capsaspora owczarzaki ATCC 30864]|uniref:Transmembrane 9 superfamily member n=1 Tax=Capsaspora owczarzaki (strain ATCC 30864) TaxID=595528 RepID=A0A0D2X216_CAPO3|nr:transmembrane 9 superfamily member 1 [Capsaspora owczarzaki ATCC 30864]KJE91774.1 transmembrane 9 superfamily member 1 [Capsaspora owczarzaki ATCC 30864]|eukprot:XP_004363702.2 transmembrane 9 superfamily member 1 [Capsaspora owczarzaki ATCC 30864]
MHLSCRLVLLAAVLFAGCVAPGVEASKGSAYAHAASVPVFVNKVGPYYNPSETYDFYSLPFCQPKPIVYKKISLGEALTGWKQANTPFDIKFGVNVDNAVLCDTVMLSKRDVQDLREAIEELYFFEFSIDDLPVWGSIGRLEEVTFPHTHRMFLWRHYHFYFEYNGDRIVYANVTMDSENPVEIFDLMPDKSIEFTYSVAWIPTTLPADKRMTHFASDSFFPTELEVHWLSIINSVSLVVLLTGVVAIIMLRVLRADFARYTRQMDDLDEQVYEDSGWKVIHGDVFRFPEHRTLFCAVLGVGTQFLVVCGLLLAMALFGMFNVHQHGSMNSAVIAIYALTSGISGYISGSFFKKIGGQNWVWNIMLTACLFSVPFFLVWSIINSIAWAYESTQALPVSKILIVMCLWLFVGFPLTVVGGIVGKNSAASFDAPVRTKNIPREIPPASFFRSTPALMIAGGFLPFSAISIELYYIFDTLWGRQPYTLFGILAIVFVILLLVTACVSIALTYYSLAGEDYQWWWRSILNAGSTGLFVLVYSVFYYFHRSNMSGALQTAKFFGYTLMTCLIFFLMLGSVGFFVSLQFVRYIFRSLKAD